MNTQLTRSLPAAMGAAAAAAPPLAGGYRLPDLLALGEVLVSTGFLPAHIKTPQQVAAIVLKGAELQVPAMYALSNIAVIQGKPAANAELLLALVYRDHGDDAVVFTETSAERATISYKRRGWRERRTFTFSLDDARTAGLTGGNWAKYPGAMLRARCISAVARLAFPDTIGGMHLPEELGATVDAETGEILSPAPPPTAAPARTAVARVAEAEPDPDDDEEDDPEEAQREREKWIDAYGAAWDGATAAGLKVTQPRDVPAGTTMAQIQRWTHALQAAVTRHREGAGQ